MIESENGVQGVGGSNPLAPTNKIKYLWDSGMGPIFICAHFVPMVFYRGG